MVLSLYLKFNKILYNSESLHKLLSYYILIDNNISTSNSKLYHITIEHTSKLVPNDPNLPSMMVLLLYIIIIKVNYNGESLHNYVSYYSLIYNSISTSNTKVYVIKTEHISKPVPNYTNIFSLMVLLLYFIV